MKHWLPLVLLVLPCTALAQQEPVAPEILKYHELLRKRPQAGTIFERFQDAWLANGTRDTLREFLKTHAAAQTATAADHQLLALFFARQGEDTAAVAELEAVLKLDAANAGAWLEKARAQTRLLRFEEALASLEAAAKSTKDALLRVEIARQQGRALLRLGRNDDALKIWQALAAERPDDLDLAEEVIELMADEYLYAEAAKQAEALVAKTPAGAELLTRRLRLGDLLLRADKRDEAMKVFESVLEQSGQDSWVEGDVLARIAQPFRREDDIDGLKKRLESLHAASPLRPAVTMELAEVKVDLGETEEAVKLITALLERTPGRRDLQERFVSLLERMERFDAAAEQMKRLTEQHTEDKELLVRLATLHEKLKDTKAAQAALDLYLKKAAGKNAAAQEHDYLRVARLLESWERKDAAGAVYDALASAHPDSVSAKEALAHFHHRNEAHDKALEIWRALTKSGGIEDVLRAGQALQSHGKQREALDLLQTRAGEFAQQPRFLAQLSQLATALEEHPQAMAWARQRLALITDHGVVPEAVRMAQITIEDAEAVKAVIEELQKKEGALSIPDRCLLAALLEHESRAEEADKVLQMPAAAPAELLMLGAQRARLLEARQEWARAAGVIEDLMKLPGGQTSEHARRLVSLHRRALANDKALAVIPEWKKLSPGAVQPWLEESAIHLEQGKENASLDVLRQASRKFADDRKVLATLAEALARAGRTDEARRAYVSLYEQTEDVQTRLRLLAPLAEMSRAEGRLDSLLEEFQTRQRQNRGSAAPWMALAEIHRTVNNDEERRRCLYEASRLRPKDLLLLTEIARCEEESGLTKEALRTLEAAATLDKTPATKQTIARLMIESGDDEAGYRLLFELAGGADADARTLEKMADTMCEHGDWARAIRFLQPVLAQHPGDYRLRYLHATALEEEGREQDAVAAFTELLGFHIEMPEVSAVQSQQMIQAHGQMPGSFSFGENYQLPDGAAEWMTIPSVAQAAYEHRSRQSQLGMGWGGRMFGGGVLILSGQPTPTTSALPRGWVAQPPNVTMLSAMALYHLIEIGQGMTKANKEALAARISAAGLRDAALILEVPIYQGAFGVPVELLNQHPDHAALHAVWLVSRAYLRGPEEDSITVLRRCMNLFKDSKPLLAWQAGVRAMLLGTPEGLEIGREAITMAEEFPEVDGSTLNALTNLLATATSDPAFMNNRHVELPADMLDTLFELGQRWNERAFDAVLRKQGYWSGQQVIGALAAAKRWPQLAVEIERENKRTLEFEKRAKSGRLARQYNFSPYSSSNAARLQPQPLQPAWSGLEVSASIANTLLSLSRTGGVPVDYDGADMSNPPDEDDVRKGLEQTLAQLKSPELKMLMQLRIGRSEDVGKAVTAMLEGKEVQAGHWLMAAWIAQYQRDWPLMVERLQKGAALDTSSNFDNAILHAAQQASPEQRSQMHETLKAVFARQNRPNMQTYEFQQLVGLMRTTGFEKEAEELQAGQTAKAMKQTSPAVLAAINPYSRNLARNSGNGMLSPLVEKLLGSGQAESAHAEILRTLRPLARQWLDPMQWGNTRYTMRNTIEQLERKTAVAGFGKWLAARTGAGWRELTEDAAILENLALVEEAASRYAAAIKQHPRAWQAQMRHATLLAARDPVTAAKALTGMPTVEMLRFVQRVMHESSHSDEHFTFENRLTLIRLMTAWLDTQTAEKRRIDPGLAQLLMNLPQYFQREEYREPNRFPALYGVLAEGQKTSESGLKAMQQLREAHDAYCTAMTRLPTLAEGGFAPLAGLALRDKLPLDKLEQQARDILSAKSWVQRAAPSTLYWNGFSSSRYGAQNQIAMPHPEDVLVRAAAQRGQFEQITSEVIPLIEKAKGQAAARQARAYAELFRAGNDSFTTAAETWLKSLYPQSDPGAGGEIVRVWSERKLSAPIHDFFLERIKSQQNGVNPEEICHYLLTLENGGNLKEASAFVRRVRDLWLGSTPEKRQIVFDAYTKEREAQRSSRGYYYGGNGNRLQAMYRYNQLHQHLLQTRVGSLAGLPVLIEDGMLDVKILGQEIGYLLMSDALVKGPTDKLLSALDMLHMLDDAPGFRPWFSDAQERRTIIGRLIGELHSSDSKEAAQRLQQALQARTKRTFGADLILTLMDQNSQSRTSAVSKFISSHAQDLTKLTPAAREELHALFGEQVDAYPGSLNEAERKAITPLLEAEESSLMRMGDKILAAPTWSAVGLEEYHARTLLPRLLAVISSKDHAKAVKILEASVTLLKGTQGHIQNAASGSSPLNEVLGQMGAAPRLMNETIAIVEREKISTRWSRDYHYSLSGDEKLRDPEHVLAIFTGTPFVAEAEQFRCLPLPDNYEVSALNRIAQQLRSGSYKAAHDALEKELKERQPRTFGMKTTQLLMSGSNFQGDAYLRENSAAFAKLRPEEADGLLRTLEKRSSKYASPDKLPPDLRDALQPLITAREKIQDGLAERLLSAPTLQSVNISTNETQMLALMLRRFVAKDAELAGRLYEKLTLLFMGESRRQNNGSAPEHTPVANWLRECAGIAPFFSRVMKRAETEGISSVQEWLDSVAGEISQNQQLEDPAFVTTLLKGSVMLEDDKLFNALTLRSHEDASLVSMILRYIRNQKAAKEAVRSMLRAEKPVFGVRLWLALLEDEPAGALREFAVQNSAQIAAMARAPLMSLAVVLESQLQPLPAQARDLPALAPVLEIAKKRTSDLAEAYLAARDSNALYRFASSSSNHPRDTMRIASYDAERGVEVARHLLKIQETNDARNPRDQPEHTNAARFLQYLKTAPSLWPLISAEAVKRKLDTSTNWRGSADGSTTLNGHEKNAPFVIALFENSGLFGPAETYDPLPGLGGRDAPSALQGLIRSFWRDSNRRPVAGMLRTHIDAQQTRTFGMDLVRCLVDDKGDEAVRKFVSAHADDLLKLRKEVVPLVAEALATRTEEFIEYPPALRDLIKQKATSFHEMVMEGKPFEEFKFDTRTFETQFRNSLSTTYLKKADFDGGAVFFDKALRIMEARQQQHGWDSNQSNGWTLRSELLSKILANAPVNVFCFGMHLFHEDDSGLLACSGWHTANGWGPWMRGRWEFWGGRASAAEGMNGLVTEITRYMKPQHATLLGIPFHNLFTRLQPGDVSLITTWAENEKADGARAAILREAAVAGRLFLTASAEGRGPDGTCETGGTPVIDLLMKHHRKAITNDQINPRVRVALALHLCNICPFAVPPDLVKKAAQLAAHENKELHCVSGSQLAHIMRRFVHLPADDEWKRTAQELWDGWARRQSFAKETQGRGRYYGTHDDPTFAMVQIAAGARNERWLTQLLDQDAPRLKTLRTTVALIATSGWETRAAEFLNKEVASLHAWNSAIVKWEPAFAKSAAALAKACKDPGMALIGELIVAESQNYPRPFVRAFKEPSTFEERISRLAPRVATTPFPSEALRVFAATFISNYAPRAAIEHLDKLLTAEAARIDISSFAELEDDGLRAETAYVLSGSIARSAIAGDAKPWNAAFAALADITGENLYLRNYARNRLADTLSDTLSTHWQAGGKPDAEMLKSVVMPVIESSGDSRDDYTGHMVSLLMPLLAASGDTALADWRASLDRKQLSTVIAGLNQKDEVWRNAGRLAGDEFFKSRLPLTARLKLVTHLLADDVIAGRFSQNEFAKMVDEGVLSRREIAENAVALHAALAKKGRHAITLAEHAIDAGKAEIAREVIDSALKATPSPSVETAFDLLEMRFGIEVREKRKPQAQEAYAKLQAHEKASANAFTLPVLKRLLDAMK